MTRDELLREIEGIFRSVALAGSDRDISEQAPLGGAGLGLDSLALVGFVTAVENRFQIDFPDEIWIDRDGMTLRRFADYIERAKPAVVQAAEPLPPRLSSASGEASIWSKVHRGVREQGILFVLKRAVRKYLLNRGKRYVLIFDLERQKIPAFAPEFDITLRVGTPEDLPALREFSASGAYITADTNVPITESICRKRMSQGYVCLAAFHREKIVGIDWLTEIGYPCPFTGLTLAWPRDCCYAMELSEREAHQGKTIGMALLAFSLQEAQKRGFRRQITWVNSSNVKMLAAAIHVFGFSRVGQIETIRLLGKRFSKWRIGEKSGRGGVVMMDP